MDKKPKKYLYFFIVAIIFILLLILYFYLIKTKYVLPKKRINSSKIKVI